MNANYEKLTPYLEKANALTSALALLQWDMETLAPPAAADNTAKTVGILSDEYFKTLINPEVKALLITLQKEVDTLTENEAAIIRELGRTYDQLETIPSEEYRAYSELTIKSSSVWAEAREKDDFEMFAPYLKEIIEYKKRFATYRKKGQENLYDILLSDYEPDFTMKELDEFFALLRKELVPLIKVVAEKANTVKDSFLYESYDIDTQRVYNKEIADYIGFEADKGVIAESAHPFTTNLHNKDVRITSHYYEHNMQSAIFSTIHEGGHAIYEMNIDDSITQTLIGTGASMAMHESQSRFYENVIGRNINFWEPLYPRLKELYKKQLGSVSLEQFVLAINKSQPSLIRTEADELTYAMHVMVRYELEKMIFNNEITVEELPQAWNDKYEEYLGVRPGNNKMGVLQDTHWSWGDFGYFPSYAIGSAISAQLYYDMLKKLPFDEYLREGNLEAIKQYLKENIHQYGMKYSCGELVKKTTKEVFNPMYFVNYLKEKYTKLYQL